MIKPQSPAEQPSPLDSLAATIALMGKNRKFLVGVEGSLKAFDLRTLLDDLEMATTEHVVVGLRTAWARRVAVPVLNAHRALAGEGDEQAKARKACEILRQCTDEAVRDTCINWVKGKHHV